jgi:iron(III) transport system ATP-binding protein
MKTLQRRLGVTTIMVTHDQEEALTMADRIVVMNQGVIEQVGTPTEIYSEPDTLFVADFIGAMNQVDGRVVSDECVAVGEFTFTSRSHNLPTGDPVVVAIRPEDIVPLGARTVGVANSEGDSENTFDAVVEDMEFLGSFWRVLLTNKKLGDVKLMADMSINAVRRMSITTGDSVPVELPAKRIWGFPPDSGA